MIYLIRIIGLHSAAHEPNVWHEVLWLSKRKIAF